MKLDTAADILEWADGMSEPEQRGGPWMEYQVKVFTPDAETAETLAFAMRVLAIVEEDEAGDHGPTAEMCRNILKEAKEQRK